MTAVSGRARDRLVAGSLAALSLVVFLLSPNRQVTDSHFTLLLSESLLRHGSFALDRYFVPPLDPARHPRLRPDGLPSQIRAAPDGHLYYFFPAGSAVLSAPFVALMNEYGWSAVGPDRRYDMDGERRMQSVLAAVLMAVLTGVLYDMARLFVPPLPAALATLAGVFGSQVWSTASRGLWSVTWQLLLLSLVLRSLAAREQRGAVLRPALLATVLAWAYFVRPTSALSILAVGLYMIRHQRRLFARFAATGSLWLLAFVGYSLLHFDALLPAYYEGGRLSLEGFGSHLLGNLVAPSRGLLVFCPVLVVLAAGLVAHRTRLPASRLLAPALVAIGAHLAVVSAFPDWAGGHSYGPRMTADLVPWLFLLGLMALGAGLRAPRPLPLALAGVLCLWGLFVHARGALAGETWEWNLDTAIDANVSRRVWDWSYPQFLAGLIETPRPDRQQLPYPAYRPGTRVRVADASTSDHFPEGWSRPVEGLRWSAASEAVFTFALAEREGLTLRAKLAPFLAQGRIPQQRVALLLNGRPLGERTLSAPEAVELSIPIPAQALAARNLLLFRFPDARPPAAVGQGRKREPRAVGLEWILLSPAQPAPRADRD